MRFLPSKSPGIRVILPVWQPHRNRLNETPPRPPMRWQLESLFADLNAYETFRTSLHRDLLAALETAAGPDSHLPEKLEANLLALESLGARVGHASCWLECRAAADTLDVSIRGARASFAELAALHTRIASAVRNSLRQLDLARFNELLDRPALASASHALRQLWLDARTRMSGPEEDLTAVLSIDGIHGWGRLYDTLSGEMEFDLHLPDGTVERTPMARRRSLMANGDRRIRKAAFEDGQKPWNAHAESLAASLNAIAGTRLKLCERRGGRHFLDDPLLDAGLSRKALDAMFSATLASADRLRTALCTAAANQGTTALAFYDLEAPQVPAPEGMRWDWDSAVKLVREAFDAGYPALGAYLREMLDKRWIEAESRPGKRPGAFCTSSAVAREERVYMTHNDTLHDTVTLAHEVGHAWHSALLRPERPFRSNYPMTLAETASNFGEIILFRGLLQSGRLTPPQTAYIRDQLLQRASGYLLNIPMRFEFERRFYEERAAGEVSVARLRELMSEAQRKVYAHALEQGGEDPMFWASKMHFFITEVSFYNFPYTFGFLLAHAIAKRLEMEGPSVIQHYELFLAASGSGTCEEVCLNTLGFDLTSEAFWSEAVQAACEDL
jgi:oligoendopeptidase F